MGISEQEIETNCLFPPLDLGFLWFHYKNWMSMLVCISR